MPGGSMIKRLAVLRILMFAYGAVWSTVRAPHLLDSADLEAIRLDAIGPLWFLDTPLPDGVVLFLVVITPLAAALAAAGWRYRVSAPVAALAFLLITTYRNSWGQLFHTENLASLQLIVLALAPAAAGHWSVDARRGRAAPIANGDDGDWAVKSMAVLAVGTYFLAGVAKLRIGGWGWVSGDTLVFQVTFDNVRKDLLGDPSSPLAAWFIGQGWLMAPSAVASMVLELGAPLALLHRRAGQMWAVSAMGFHLGVLLVMYILFPYHLLGIGVAPLLAMERVPDRLARTTVGRAWTRHFRPHSTALLPPG